MAEERQSTEGGSAHWCAQRRALARGFGSKVNALAELLGDLLEATGLVTPDKLAEARTEAGADGLAGLGSGRAGRHSLAAGGGGPWPRTTTCR